MQADSQLKKGEAVSWSSHGSTARGTVIKKITTPMTIKANKVAASKENPEYLVETDDGKRAAHKPDALSRTPGRKSNSKAKD